MTSSVIFALACFSLLYHLLPMMDTAALHKVPISLGASASLPTSLWAEILQHVPQQQRLCQCAFVCRAWATAAAQATVHVVKDEPVDRDIPSLQSWLQLYAGQVHSLELADSYYGPKFMLQLPLDKLTKLQRLQLNTCRLKLPGEEDSKGNKSADDSMGCALDGSQRSAQLTLSSLQHLTLTHVELVGISSLLQLTKAPQLTSLQLQSITVRQLGLDSLGSQYDDPLAAVQQLAEAMPQMLQQLPLLADLKLPGGLLTDSAMQQLCATQKLQELEYKHIQHSPLCELQHLPSSITHLWLTDNRPPADMALVASLPPELRQLSGLQHLDLELCTVPVKVLTCFTQLRVLYMGHCSLLPCSMPDDAPDTEGTAALLEVLNKLTLLQQLELTDTDLDTIKVAPQQFSALTASSHLMQLTVSQTRLITLPKGAVQHMFPVGRQMQHLQDLAIRTGDSRGDLCLDAADLECIIRCCPQLQSLDITSSVEPGSDLSVLLQLSSTCTQLQVGGLAFTDAATPVLSQLTQLRELTWSCSPEMTVAGLEQLVGLDLEMLSLSDCGVFQGGPDNLRGDMFRECDPMCLECDPELGSVWQQLVDLFDEYEPNVAARLNRHIAAAKEQKLRVEVSSLQQQLALKVHQLADREQQLACSQAEITRLQQQLAAAQAGQIKAVTDV